MAETGADGLVNGSRWWGTPRALQGYPHLRELRPAYVVRGIRLLRLEERAKAVIHGWLSRCRKPYVSFSCGKDSTVVAALVRQVDSSVPLVRHSSAEPHLPDVEEMLAWWRGQGSTVIEFVFGSLFEWYRKWGFESPRIDQEYKRIVLAWDAEQGWDGSARGLRAEESAGRRRLRRATGALRLTQGVWMCDPIIDWTADEVWAYIAWKRLPYASVYDIEDGRPRHERRLGSIWGTSAAQYGRIARLKRHYPALYNHFVRHFPEVSRYA